MMQARLGKAGRARRVGRRIGMGTLALGMAALLSGCGIFGCGGAATNGGFLGGCEAGMRF
jgi:hypothetical protein